MRWTSRLRLAVRDLIRRDEFERQIDEELHAFVELDAEARLRQGEPRDEALRFARAGVSLESTKERLRDLRAGHVLQTIGQDLRFGARALRRHPGFAAAVIVTIALGIGPLTIVLGFANWLFVRPVPGVSDRGDLVQVEFVTRSPRGGIGRASMSYANYHELMSSLRVFDGFAGEMTTTLSVATANSNARRAPAGFVMYDYFDVLGVSLERGRAFTAAEDREPDGAPVAILSRKLATGLFGDPDQAIGRQMHINGLPFTVIGVVSRAFTGLQPGGPVELWLTGATWPHVSHVPPERRNRGRANGLFNVFIGRLAPDVTFAQAQSELTRATRLLAEVDPAANSKFAIADVWMERRPGLPIRLRPQVAQLVWILGIVGALLLVIAAANVSNLLLFHGVRRRNEIAVRLALGATRWRLVRAHLLDSVLLALMGSVCGLLLAFWGVRLFEGFLLPGIGQASVQIDWRVIAQATFVAVAMACAFGVLPAMVASRPHAAIVLRSASSAVTRRGRYVRSGLTAIQLGLSLTLLIGALLLISTMRNLRGVDTGTDPSRVTALFLDLGTHGYSVERARVFFERFLEQGRSTSVAEGLAMASRAPFFGATTIARVHPASDVSSAVEVASNGVTPGYFAALSIPLLRGREFTNAEAFAAPDGACGPVIVSALLARRLFGDQDPLGREIGLPRNAIHSGLECAIVGVVADVRWSGPATEPEPMLYRPLARDPLAASSVAILARSARPTAQVAAAMRKAAASIDPTVPLSEERRLTEVIENRMADRRLTSAMLTLLAIVGFLLAAVGLYGLVAETVAERRREFGIRMAVGADASRIFRAVVSGAGWIALPGIAGGLAAAMVLARALRTQLFGVVPLEPAVYILSAAVLVMVVVLASLIPARAATRVDPVAALKAE